MLAFDAAAGLVVTEVHGCGITSSASRWLGGKKEDGQRGLRMRRIPTVL